MEREEVQVTVDTVTPFINDKYTGICIKWFGNIGFGEYNLYKINGEDRWHGDSEYMDSNDDKWFLKMLMEQFIERIEIE